MAEEHTSVKAMWHQYLKSINEDVNNTDKKYISWHFCDNEKDANDLANLTKAGIKRATTSLYYWYEVEGEVLPQVGDLNIITNWNGEAKCIIKTKEINIVPFREVTEEFAKTEGEGDKSLEYWKKAHIKAFSRGLKEVGKDFFEDMLVVYEEFELVYK